MKWLGILFIAVLLAMAPAAGSAQQQKDTSATTQTQGPAVKGEAAATATSVAPADRQAYEKKTAEELDAIQNKIGDMRMKAATGASQNKRMVARAANKLQMQQFAAAKELKALKKAPETAWKSQKAKLDKAMADLRQAMGQTAPQ